MRYLAKKILEKFGLEVRWKSVLRPQDQLEGVSRFTPLESLYRAKWENLATIWMEPSRMVNCIGYSFRADGDHPFVQSLREYRQNGEAVYGDSPLKNYYDTFQPKNLMELLFGYSDLQSELSRLRPVDFGIPFSYCESFEEVEATAKKWIRNENLREGVEEVDLLFGSQSFGPVTDEKGRAELARLVRVYDSIRERGYEQRPGSEGDIRAYLLRRDNEFRAIIFGGHHRAAALSVLGYKKVPVRLWTNLVIETRDVESWPLVQAGVWPSGLAIQYIDRLFDGG